MTSMSHHTTIRRYTLIIEKIIGGTYPSFEMIKEYLERFDFPISKRTLQRDIEQIRNEFGVEVKYDRPKNGYVIDEEESVDMESFVRFLEIVSTADLMKESLQDSKDSLSYISFGSSGNLNGIEYLKPILNAIRHHVQIKVDHENYWSGKRSVFTIKPYLLKEFQGRWYVVGYIGNMKEFRTIAIDRIHELTTLEKTFKPDNVDVKALFENVVGLTYSIDKQQLVELWFDPFQAKYIKSLPLHNSQEVISDDENGLIVHYQIIPNFEFIQAILKHGENVKVLKPAKLRNEIKRVLKESLKRYE